MPLQDFISCNSGLSACAETICVKVAPGLYQARKSRLHWSQEVWQESQNPCGLWVINPSRAIEGLKLVLTVPEGFAGHQAVSENAPDCRRHQLKLTWNGSG